MNAHRHDWQPNPALNPDRPGHNPAAPTFACTECPATAQQCSGCPNVLEHAGRTCPDCVSRARNRLRDVRDLYRQLPDVIATVAGLHAVRYDRGTGGRPGKTRSTDTTIVGGAAFVMVAGGTATGHRLGRGETSIDPELLDAEKHDPPSVWAVLTFWEDAWRAEHGDPAAPTNSLDEAITYLLDHTDWAAQQSATWDEWLTDLGNLRARLRRLTGEAQPPVESGVPCPYCAGQVVQKWTKAGLDDTRVCDRCARAFATEEHFMLAIRQAHQDLPNTRPDQLVTLDDAKRIYRGRVRPNLLDVWVTRGNLKAAVDEQGRPRRDVRGDALYRLGTIDDWIGSGKVSA